MARTIVLPYQWYSSAMITTIDASGRLVIPKALRDQLGLVPGAVEVVADGAALRVAAIAQDGVVERDGRLVISASGAVFTDAMVRDAIEGGRR